MKRNAALSALLLLIVCAAFGADAARRSSKANDTGPLPPPPAQGVPGQRQVLVEFQLARVQGDVSGETSLTDNLGVLLLGLVKGDTSSETLLADNVLENVEGEQRNATRGPFTFFVTANLHLGGRGLLEKGVRLEANDTTWTWDGKPNPPAGKRVTVVCAPRVLVIAGESFKIEVGSVTPVQYFEKRPDGLFELRTADEVAGLILSGTPQTTQSGRIILRDLSIQLRTVEGRAPIEGVFLDVGKPQVKLRGHKTTLALKPDRYYGAMVSIEGEGFFILRLRAKLVESAL